MRALKARLSRLETKNSVRPEPRILVYECADDWPEDERRAFVAEQLGEATEPALVVCLNRFGMDCPPRVVRR